MLKKEVSTVTKTISIYGPTDYSDELVAELNGKKIFRSDYLDKLNAEIAKPSSKLIRDFKKIAKAEINGAVGHDADHPFVTVEKNKARAWRYIAIVKA